MGMSGNWARVAPGELSPERRPPAERSISTDKNWAGFDYLLRRHGFPVDIVFGEETFPGTTPGDEFSEGTWGYGPPTYLTPERVAEAARALAALSPADLIRGVTPDEVTAADRYSFHPDDLLEVAAELPAAQRLFTAAAEAGDAVLCWLD